MNSFAALSSEDNKCRGFDKLVRKEQIIKGRARAPRRAKSFGSCVSFCPVKQSIDPGRLSSYEIAPCKSRRFTGT